MEISEPFLIDAEKKVFDVEQKTILKNNFAH